MRWTLSLILLIAGASFAHAAQFGFGAALESRFQREVNPDYADVKALGLLNAKFKFPSWTVLVETGNESQSSSSGSISIRSETQSVSLWSRYEFYDQPSWSPYLGGGVGGYYDMVRTTFGTDVSEKTGSRAFMGASAGLTRTFFGHFTLDIEGRAQFVEDRKDPYLSGLLRLDFEI